jgi:hypothetical protein
LTSPSSENFQEFVAVCRTQIDGREWMRQWPGSIDRNSVAQVLRPLAQKYRAAERLSDDEVIATIFTDGAFALLSDLRNQYCFFVIVEIAARHIGDYSSQIGAEAVREALKEQPDMPRRLT